MTFTRLEGLADLIGDHIIFLLPSGDAVVLPLGKQKLRIDCARVTFVCGDQFFVIRFIGVLRVIGSVGQAFSDSLTAVLVHGNDAGCSDWRSPP